MSGRIYEPQSVSAGRYRTEVAQRRALCFVGCALIMIIVGAVLVFDILPKKEKWQPAGSSRLIPSTSPSGIIYDSQGAGTHFRDFTDFPTMSPTTKRLPTTSIPTSPPPPTLAPAPVTPEPTAPSIQ